jgi:hypothetical protein
MAGQVVPNYPPTFDGAMMLCCVRCPPQPGQTNGRIPATRASPPRFLMRSRQRDVKQGPAGEAVAAD